MAVMDDLEARIVARLKAAADHAERAGMEPAYPTGRGYGLAVQGDEYGDALVVLSLDAVARIAAEVARES
jgi:hypothetical protein